MSVGPYLTAAGGRVVNGPLLRAAEKIADNSSENVIDKKGAQALAELALDGGVYSPMEKDTIAYVRENLKFTGAGDKVFRTRIRQAASNRTQEAKEYHAELSPQLPEMFAKLTRRNGSTYRKGITFEPAELLGIKRFVHDQTQLMKTALADPEAGVMQGTKKQHTYDISLDIFTGRFEQDADRVDGQFQQLVFEDYFEPAATMTQALAGLVLEDALNDLPEMKEAGIRFRVQSRDEISTAYASDQAFRIIAKRS